MSNRPEPTLEAVLVSAADLAEIHVVMVEIRTQNTTMLSEMRQNQKGWEERHAGHDKRIRRLERGMIFGLLLAAAVGFATGWRWRGETAQANPQIIYTPVSAP